jgi:hypothetical protein
MATGKVDSWNGWTGHLVDDADQAKVFFGDWCLAGVEAWLVRPGLVVEFERRLGPTGPVAQNVRAVPAGNGAHP